MRKPLRSQWEIVENTIIKICMRICETTDEKTTEISVRNSWESDHWDFHCNNKMIWFIPKHYSQLLTFFLLNFVFRFIWINFIFWDFPEKFWDITDLRIAPRSQWEIFENLNHENLSEISIWDFDQGRLVDFFEILVKKYRFFRIYRQD